MIATLRRNKMIPCNPSAKAANPQEAFNTLLQQAWQEHSQRSRLGDIIEAEMKAPDTPEARKVIEKLYGRWKGH